ncbi:mitotic spindle assembly checkpoint protein MAD2B [Scaptodrosophila lebanonensis]|uniref:Mitotic spindle assembly checkpoint protein MAD2B n=1 Tax=Drosophila lebanonensis TaxID=7225 RepID=A0A6J2TL77_DROLE|nr:mitotic spindle assembly checkpoint protein MAD2B [Scaptodrosophila lebanonensis]
MLPESCADILLEAIEVLVNHLLYVRGVYPPQIFKKRRVFNTPVFVSIYPPLNNYLTNILNAAQELLRRQELQCLEVIIYRDDMEHMESYRCELESLPNGQDDQYLLLYEQQLRAALYKLSERLKPLPKLTEDAKFKVHLHTTQSAFIQLNNNAQHQEFPWLQATAASNVQTRGPRQYNLLPLTAVDKVGLKMQAHIFT